MEPWYSGANPEIVEAIEEGKIVRVHESYAKKEGLLIIRKAEVKKEVKKKPEEPEKLYFEDFRRPLNWKNSQVVAELSNNFNWEISKRRKELGLTRRQLAKAINDTENNIKMLENGALPKNDFIIINKIQSYLNINLRKDKKNFSGSARSLITEKPAEVKKENLGEKKESESTHFLGDDIEIIE